MKREEEKRLDKEAQEEEKRLAKKTSEEERRLLREEQEEEKMMREEEKRLDRELQEKEKMKREEEKRLDREAQEKEKMKREEEKRLDREAQEKEKMKREEERRLLREEQEKEKMKREEEKRLDREAQEEEKRLAKKTSEEERRLLREEQEEEKRMREEERRLAREAQEEEKKKRGEENRLAREMRETEESLAREFLGRKGEPDMASIYDTKIPPPSSLKGTESDLASTSGLFDEILRFLNSTEVPETELEPSELKNHRSTLQNAINYFKCQSHEYREGFNKLSEEEKKIIKAKVDLFPAFGEVICNLYSSNTFVKSELFKIACDALDAMFAVLIKKIGGESGQWIQEFIMASHAISKLKNSITALFMPQFEALCDPLKDSEGNGQEVVNKVQAIFDDGDEMDVGVLKGFKNRQVILDRISTIKEEYSKKFYLKSQRIDDYAKGFGPVIEILKNENVSKEDKFKQLPHYFMRFLLFDHLASQSEENLVKLLFVQGDPVIQRFWDKAKIIFERDENLNHGYLVRHLENKRDTLKSLLFTRYYMTGLIETYPGLKSVGEECMKKTFFSQAKQEQVTSEIGVKEKNAKAKTEEIASGTEKSEIKPPNEAASSEIISEPMVVGAKAKATTSRVDERLPEQRMKSMTAKSSLPQHIQPSELGTSDSETKTLLPPTFKELNLKSVTLMVLVFLVEMKN